MIQGGSNKPKNHVDFKSEFYFSTPVWIAQAPMFLKSMNAQFIIIMRHYYYLNIYIL